MKYLQAQKAIVDLIAQDDLEAGSRLPSEGDLAKYCGVSGITIRRALQELGSLGVIERIQGKGTFVKRPPADGTALGSVAMVVTGRDPQLYEGMFGSIQRALGSRGFTARFVVANEPTSTIARDLAHVSGVLISGQVTEAWGHFLQSLALPFVVIGSCETDMPVWRVDCDWTGATRTIVHALNRRGCRRIGFINGAKRYPPALSAFDGFRQAMEELALPIEDECITWCQRGEYDGKLDAFFASLATPLDGIVVEQGIFPTLLSWFYDHGFPRPCPLLGIATSRQPYEGVRRRIVHVHFDHDLTQRGVERLFEIMGNHREPPRTEWLSSTLHPKRTSQR